MRDYRLSISGSRAAMETESTLVQCRLVDADLPSPSIRRLFIEPMGTFDYRPGQYLRLIRNDMLGRRYSIASVPELDDYLELHVRIVPHGQFSNWVHDHLDTEEVLGVSGPYGESYYLPGRFDQPLLLIGTGTGLAPLLGVVRDALRLGHTGSIHLYHGNTHAVDLYCDQALRELSRERAHFHYHPCVSGEETGPEVRQGWATDIAFDDFPNLNGWRVFLSGLPSMVRTAERVARLQGANPVDIYADAFDFDHEA